MGSIGFLLRGRKDASFESHRPGIREQSDAKMIEGRVRGLFFLHCGAETYEAGLTE